MRLQRVSRAADGMLLTIDFILVDDNLASVWSLRSRIGSVSVVSHEALIAMEALAARPIEIADIEKLREIDR
jgi:hypothetical protein